MLLSTPGLRLGMEGCGKGISPGSCMRSTKPTPHRSGSADVGSSGGTACGASPWQLPREKEFGGQSVAFQVGSCSSATSGGVCLSPLTTPRAARSGPCFWMSLSLFSEESSLVALGPEAEIAPLGKSPPLPVSPCSCQEPELSPRAPRWVQEVGGRQRVQQEDSRQSSSLPWPPAAGNQVRLLASRPLHLHQIQHPFFFCPSRWSQSQLAAFGFGLYSISHPFWWPGPRGRGLGARPATLQEWLTQSAASGGGELGCPKTHGLVNK